MIRGRGQLSSFIQGLTLISAKVSYNELALLWMEEILHQLVDELSHCNPII